MRSLLTLVSCVVLIALAYPNNQEYRAAPLDKLDWNTNRLRSQWYWFESEVKGAKTFPDRNLYKSMQADVEAELREEASICPMKSHKGTSWTVCK